MKVDSNYTGKLDVGMFESTSPVYGNAYVPVDYTGLDMSYSLSLKSLSLSSDELKAVSGIALSPAIYYVSDFSGKLELMRLSSSTAPIGNIANGGDFSVSLKSISNTSQKTR